MGHPARRYVSPEQALSMAKTVLETPFWPEQLQPMKSYSRLHDDHDGTKEGYLNVVIDPSGDVYIETIPGDGLVRMLRFRMEQGGGLSPRVRNALVILALAIDMDNKE